MMIKKSKTVLSVFAGVCLITAMFSACAQTGTSRAPGYNKLSAQTTGLGRNNLVNATTQYSQMNTTLLGINQGTTLGRNLGTTLAGTTLGSNLGTGTTLAGTTLGGTTLNRQKADAIKRQLVNMTGVDKANVVVMGNTALVGFKPIGNTRNVGVAKTNIAKKVKAVDKTITNVVVSESTGVLDRINKLSMDITSNKPINAITTEFNNIVKGIAPVAR